MLKSVCKNLKTSRGALTVLYSDPKQNRNSGCRLYCKFRSHTDRGVGNGEGGKTCQPEDAPVGRRKVTSMGKETG